VGTFWRGGPIDAAERFSPTNTTTEEVVDFPRKEEGHCESRGLNLTEFVRDPKLSLIHEELISYRRSLYS